MPVASASHGKFQAADLLNPSIPEKGVEILEGELVVMTPAGKFHNRIAHRFLFLFKDFCDSHPGCDFGGDNEGFLVERNPDTLLSPDACLLRARPDPEQSWMEFAPEIAVEVLSPSNNAAEMAFELRKYFEGGSEQVWIADPESESIQFYFHDGRKAIATGDEVVACEGLAEGLSISLKEIFEKG